MASSSLDHTGEQKPVTTKGQGTEALGPSDTSDSGSDICGGPGLAGDVGLGNRVGTTSEPEPGGRERSAGPDVGDANLDSDSDSSGTGERASAGRDSSYEAADIAPDSIEDDSVFDEARGPDTGEFAADIEAAERELRQDEDDADRPRR